MTVNTIFRRWFRLEMQDIPRTKQLPEQHHDKKTVNVQIYQITRKDAQIHVTNTYEAEDGSTVLTETVL